MTPCTVILWIDGKPYPVQPRVRAHMQTMAASLAFALRAAERLRREVARLKADAAA